MPERIAATEEQCENICESDTIHFQVPFASEEYHFHVPFVGDQIEL